MKELYEVRSSEIHRGDRSGFSKNWEYYQHMVISAYVFPLTVKIVLQKRNLYKMSLRERVCCDVIDQLLDSRWRRGQTKPAEWPRIIDDEYAARSLVSSVEAAFHLATRRKNHP